MVLLIFYTQYITSTVYVNTISASKLTTHSHKNSPYFRAISAILLIKSLVLATTA